MIKTARLLEKVEVIFVKFSFGFFCLALLPLIVINTLDHRRKIKRNPFSKSLIVRMYERYPLFYDLYILVMNFPLFYNVYDVLPPLSNKVLQVGCGTGALNMYLRRKKKDAGIKLYNLDTNRRSLEYGVRKGAFSDFVHSDIADAPFEDGYFDQIVFARCLHHIKNHRKIFKECVRLLSEKGKIIICDHADLSPAAPKRSYMMNSNIDGVIWRYTGEAFAAHLNRQLPDELSITSIHLQRQKCITNYNFFFPNADAVVIIEKNSKNDSF